MVIKKSGINLNNVKNGEIVLIETTAEKSLKVGIKILKSLTKDQIGIIISATRPSNNLIKIYKTNQIDIKKLLIIDCVSGSKSDSKNIINIEDVSALTKISIALTKSMFGIKGQKFIFIDSISSMLIHNKKEIFGRFLHNLLTKMRLNNAGGILISTGSKKEVSLRAEIAQLCDDVISL